MREVMAQPNTVPISMHAPFLSNLNVQANVALVLEYQEYWFNGLAQQKALEQLTRLELGHKATSHHTKLTHAELFYAQLARASMLSDREIVIDRPFGFVPFESSVEFILSAMARLEITHERVRIIDLLAIKNRYKDEVCRIEEW
ncbi:MAG: hypothetical protein KU37_04380 [Sulfuricurvum sp. PC08-66]|nr:MAG: hypothetical protein KU37_04380 [Sulfuricurvum sp. PC08-66]